MTEALTPWLTLALTPGVGPAGFLKLVARFGSADAALHAGRSALAPLLDKDALEALLAGHAADAVQQALRWAEGDGCSLLTLNDPDYPVALAESPAPPPLLFARGRRDLLSRPMLAIVGSRQATPQGRDNARDFAAGLAGRGYTVVSGLASGIDAAAHDGALAHPASTIAVIGTGIDRVYPASNRTLAHRIAEQGLILSEFPLGLGPLPQHFPRRNRIIAALARGTLVVEAGVGSGSLITARLALEAGREVMAIPGSIHNPQARGCHQLIRDGARLVESVDDVLDELGSPAPPAVPHATPPADDDTGLLAALGHDAADADTLAGRLGLTADAIYPMLLELELQGRLASLPGGRYQRLV